MFEVDLYKYSKSALKIKRCEKKNTFGESIKYFEKGELFKKHPYIEVLPGVLLLPYNDLGVHNEYEIVECCYPGAEVKKQAIISLLIDGKDVPVDILYFTYEGENKAMAFDITEHMKQIEEWAKIKNESEPN